MALTNLRLAAGMILVGAVLDSGANAWARQERKAGVPVVATTPSSQKTPLAPLPNKDVPNEPEPGWGMRTARGIVRDETGRPVAKAWVGSGVFRTEDQWRIVPFDRIRETKAPFRDDRGTIVIPRASGKYFELKDLNGKWQPINPALIRRFDQPREMLVPKAARGVPIDYDTLLAALAPDPFAKPIIEVPAAVLAAIDWGQEVFEIAVHGRWRMLSNEGGDDPADRTNSQGEFAVTCEVSTSELNEIHFTSPDFSKRAIHVVRFDNPDKPLAITLKPVRRVKTRVVEMPKDADIWWTVYSVDPADEALDKVSMIDAERVWWNSGVVKSGDDNSLIGHEQRIEFA